MASKTIEVPVADGTTREVTGYVVKIPVGEEKHRFLIHPGVNSPKAKHLTHLATGLKVGELNSAGVAYLISTGKRLTERGKAEHLIARLVAHHGLDKVQKQLNQTP